ncbi:MAG TPA: PspA/IM30 family protein [Planctomycetota bacterium]|nr:PspA/IM30 family protein [Planctomycetota bacterium]
MWARLKRIFRSFMGAFISMAEDPEMILEQNIRDMRDKIPEMNTGIAKARGGIIRLENEATAYKQDIAKLTARVKACLLAGDEAMAGQFAVQLKKQQEALERNQQQLEAAKGGYEALLKLKERYMREMKMKTEEAQRAISEARAAKWKSELADVFQTFEVAGVDATHDEMIEKLREKTALADGKIMSAVESVDMKSIEIEEKAQQLEGQELLKQFKLDLGLEKKAEGAPAASASDEEAKKALEDVKKTIGPERTKTQS